MTLDLQPTMPPATGSLKQPRLDNTSTEELLNYFENGWTLYNSLMSCLKADEDYYRLPNTLRRPLIFYLGHPAVFFINKFVAAGLLTVRPPLFFTCCSSSFSSSSSSSSKKKNKKKTLCNKHRRTNE